MRRTGSTTLLRRVNESAVLDLLRQDGALSRSDIARRLRLSAPTITRIIANLMDEGLVVEQKTGDSSGGRRPTLLQFNARASAVIGIYIGQNITGALTDLNGSFLSRKSVPIASGDAGIEQLIQFIRNLLAEAASMDLPVRGVGIGAPSIVEFPRGTVVLSPSHGWRNLPLRQIVEEAVDVPVAVENEVNVIALGESWRGAGQHVQNMVCVSLGAGIGAGLIIGGKLYRGTHNAAGEVGYIIPSERFLGRVYDTYGCLEGLAGSAGIVQRTVQRLQSGEPSADLHDLSAVTPSVAVERVFNAARAGDPLAVAVVDETVDYLTIALANLASILDPERIVIGGELVEFADLLVQPIRRRMQGLLPIVPEIVQSELKIDAPILGAVVMTLHETSDALFIQPSRA